MLIQSFKFYGNELRFIKLIILCAFMASGSAVRNESVKTKELEEMSTTKKNELGRIVGGIYTPIKDAPYMAAVQYRERLFCGASILTDQYVVSAAHCYYTYKQKYKLTALSVRVGSDYYYKEGETRTVIEISMHPNYNDTTADYDCAVLKVDSPFSKSYPYQELLLPSVGPVVGEKLLVSGWGDTTFNGTHSSKLLSVNVSVLRDEICNEFYRYGLPKSGFCAGNMDGGKDSCQGDSGGPAVKDGLILVGIVSYGYECGLPGTPGVYTDVLKVKEWIKDIIEKSWFQWLLGIFGL